MLPSTGTAALLQQHVQQLETQVALHAAQQATTAKALAALRTELDHATGALHVATATHVEQEMETAKAFDMSERQRAE